MGKAPTTAFNLKFQTQNLHNTGLSLVANYTWAHAIDDISSTFSDSLQGGSGYIGSLGYTDLLRPGLDLGNADYDVRNRFVLAPIWNTPWFKHYIRLEGTSIRWVVHLGYLYGPHGNAVLRLRLQQRL